MKVISNSSPLIVLTKINRIDLLKYLFTSVYISEEVYREVYKIKKEHCPKWIKIVKVKDRMAVDALDAVVDKSEAETIILALVSMRQIKGKLWEIKISQTRIFYAVIEGNTMVLLHAYKKQSQKAPQHEIETALRRMKDILEN